jgi:ATP adenylyltransferase
MEKLWSPWRSQYIDSIKDNDKSQGCIFCNVSKLNVDDSANLLVDKGRLTFTVLNLYPYNNGHLMVVPYRHTSDFSSLSSEEFLEVMQKLQLAEKALKIISSPEGFNIGANLGKVSGAGLDDHLHFHIVPRWNGDTNFMPILGEVKVISQDLLATKKSLVKAYAELNKV